jgi:hypothetical protein
MSCLIKFDRESNVVLEVWTGNMPKEDWARLMINRVRAPDCPQRPRMIVDTSAVDWGTDLTAADIENLVARLTQCPEEFAGARVAIITPSDWRKALILESAIERLGAPLTVIAFPRLDSACQWLGLDLATTAGEIARLRWGPPCPEGNRCER